VGGGAEVAGIRPEEDTLVSRQTLPSLAPLLAAILMAFMALNLFNGLFPTYAKATLGLAEGTVDVLNTGFAIAYTVMILFAWTVSERLGRRSTLLLGLGLMAGGLALTRIGGGAMVTGAFLIVAAAGWSLVVAHALPLVLTLAPRMSTGLYTGFYFLAFVGAGAVGQFVTPALEGLEVGSRFLVITGYLVLAAVCVLAVRHNLEPERTQLAPAK
jgi:MFS family permease